jgi:4-hydroxybenzoate polyprenyltransferase
MIAYHLDLVSMKTIQYTSLILALVGAFLINYNVLFCVIVFIGAYTFHSSSLLRLKRFWATSSLCIMLAGCAAFLAGFFALAPDQTVGHFPLAVLGMIAGILLPYSIIKDVPDMRGDTIQSILTFPRMFGRKVAIVTSLVLVLLWFVIFWKIIPWFFALAILISVITLIIQPKLLEKKAWIFGLPTTTIFIGILLHIIFIP